MCILGESLVCILQGSPRCVHPRESLACTLQGSLRCIHPRGVPEVHMINVHDIVTTKYTQSCTCMHYYLMAIFLCF